MRRFALMTAGLLLMASPLSATTPPCSEDSSTMACRLSAILGWLHVLAVILAVVLVVVVAVTMRIVRSGRKENQRLERKDRTR